MSEQESSMKILNLLLRKSPHVTGCHFEFIFLYSEIHKKITLQKFNVKEQSIQLSKIAHEIKNIILVIIGTCKQFDFSYLHSDRSGYSEDEYININQTIQSKYSSNNSLQSLKYISNLSNYLLFLIEDLNSFSRRHNGITSANIDYITEVELIPVLKFCNDIFKNKQKFDSNKCNVKI